MNCFYNYIVLPGCCHPAEAPAVPTEELEGEVSAVEPSEGEAPAVATEPVYITRLPGFTLKMADSLVTADTKTLAGLFEEIQRRALSRFRHDYTRKFAKKYMGFCCTEPECDPETIACQYKELFLDAWLYCLGIEFMNERLYSSRMNRFTTIDKPQAEELKAFYEVEYEKFLNAALCELPKELIDNCFERTSSVTRVEVLP